jgi:hypothetical protein
LNGWSRARLTRIQGAAKQVCGYAVHTGHAAEMPAMLSK